jgi:deoxyadenosine/deoxycytidine kinase
MASWGSLVNGPKMFVAIAGNIGTGKTTLSQKLSERFGWESHFESVGDNPYLTDFYGDMSRWSFPLQIYFLNHRFKAHQQIANGTRSAIQDRSIYEDANIFARNLHEQKMMQTRDYENYLDLYQSMCKFLTPPDLIIYLRKSLPKLKQQIARRGRDFEQNTPDDYLKNLSVYYDDWMENYRLGKRLIVESDDLDFVSRPEDFEKIVNLILAQLDQRDLYLEACASQAEKNQYRSSLLLSESSREVIEAADAHGLNRSLDQSTGSQAISS